MPSRIPVRRRRRAVVIAVLLALVLGASGLFVAGRFLSKEDPLQRADAIFVLGGTRVERPLEAADLYLEGWAPLIVLARATREPATRVLATRGAVFPSDEELSRDALLAIGVPTEHVLVSDSFNDSTGEEADTLRTLALAHRWSRVIVVTSRFHLRRAGFAMRRELDATGVEVVMHPSRYDPSRPRRWWASRRDVRWMLSESPKMVAYLLGLGA